jgi:hypothetical protein
MVNFAKTKVFPDQIEPDRVFFSPSSEGYLRLTSQTLMREDKSSDLLSHGSFGDKSPS